MKENHVFRIKIVSLVVSFLLLMPIVVVSAVDGQETPETESVTQTTIAEITTTATPELVTDAIEIVTTTEKETTTEEATTVVEDEETEQTEEEYIPTVVRDFYDEDDLYILSHLIYGEAGGESDECQLAVGSVVLNRVKSSSFPNSIEGVVFAPGQYACTWDGNYDKEPSQRAIDNARYLLENGSTLPDGVVFQAQFVQGEIYAEIDGEYFCYG